MPRGGRRTGKTGTAYAQRTDLNSRLPVTTVPGQPYGQAGQQAAAQQIIPMGSPAIPPPAGPAAPPSAAAAPPAESNHPEPGSLGDFLMPSVRPSEHVMTPPGPAPLSPVTQAALATLNSLGPSLPPELKGVAAYLNAAQNNGAGQ